MKSLQGVADTKLREMDPQVNKVLVEYALQNFSISETTYYTLRLYFELELNMYFNLSLRPDMNTNEVTFWDQIGLELKISETQAKKLKHRETDYSE